MARDVVVYKVQAQRDAITAAFQGLPPVLLGVASILALLEVMCSLYDIEYLPASMKSPGDGR